MSYEELVNEVKLIEGIRQIDFVTNCRTDHVFQEFCEKHPDVKVSQKRFTRMVCKHFGMKTVRTSICGDLCRTYVKGKDE